MKTRWMVTINETVEVPAYAYSRDTAISLALSVYETCYGPERPVVESVTIREADTNLSRAA